MCLSLSSRRTLLLCILLIEHMFRPTRYRFAIRRAAFCLPFILPAPNVAGRSAGSVNKPCRAAILLCLRPPLPVAVLQCCTECVCVCVFAHRKSHCRSRGEV